MPPNRICMGAWTSSPERRVNVNTRNPVSRWSRPAIIGLSLLLAVGCTDLPLPPGASTTLPSVSVAHPVSRPVVEVRRYTGRLQAAQRVEVRARVKGYLNRVLFEEGADVLQGRELYEIDPRVFRAAVDQAQAELARLEAEYQLAAQDAERSTRLQARGAITPEQHEHRLAAKAVAEAALAEGRARLDATLLDLSFTRVIAPIDGKVGRTHVTVGNLVGQSEPTLLTTIVQMDPLHLMFEVTERDLLTFGEHFGQSAASWPGATSLAVRFGLDADDGTPHAASIDFRDTEVNVSTGTVLIRAVVPNPERWLSPGMFARVEVSLSRAEPSPHVPETALATDQQGRYVFVVDADGKAQRRSVVTGPASGGLVAIEGGLSTSDRVIVVGQAKVRPGTPVVAEVVTLDRVLVARGDVP